MEKPFSEMIHIILDRGIEHRIHFSGVHLLCSNHLHILEGQRTYMPEVFVMGESPRDLHYYSYEVRYIIPRILYILCRVFFSFSHRKTNYKITFTGARSFYANLLKTIHLWIWVNGEEIWFSYLLSTFFIFSYNPIPILLIFQPWNSNLIILSLNMKI